MAAAPHLQSPVRPPDPDELVLRHRPLARRLAARYAYRPQQREDLEQVALLGLVKAARRFDPGFGTAFSTFAVPTILGELRRHCRDTRWSAHVPRPVQERVRAVRAAEEDLRDALGRAPAAPELADRLRCTVEEVLEARFAANALAPVSLDAGADEDGSPLERLGGEEPGYRRAEHRDELRRALADVPAQAKQAVLLHHGADLPLAEVARRLGVPTPRAAQLVRTGLNELRAGVRREPPATSTPAGPSPAPRRRTGIAGAPSPGSRVARSGAGPRARSVCLLDADPDLFAALAPHERLDARRLAVAPRVTLPQGPWRPRPADAGDARCGLLLIDGAVLRCVELGGRVRAELLGPGDVLRPWAGDDGDDVRGHAHWSVLVPATAARIDADVLARLCRWPSTIAVLLERTVARTRGLARQMAVVEFRRVDDRIEHLFAQLALRWGRPTPEGILVPLPLTHETVAHLVGAHRPTVTSALRRLALAGRLSRRADRTWLLAPWAAAAPALPALPARAA